MSDVIVCTTITTVGVVIVGALARKANKQNQHLITQVGILKGDLDGNLSRIIDIATALAKKQGIEIGEATGLIKGIAQGHLEEKADEKRRTQFIKIPAKQQKDPP
jgi:hypothetical protein